LEERRDLLSMLGSARKKRRIRGEDTELSRRKNNGQLRT
jgi:hypothetical protein